MLTSQNWPFFIYSYQFHIGQICQFFCNRSLSVQVFVVIYVDMALIYTSLEGRSNHTPFFRNEGIEKEKSIQPYPIFENMGFWKRKALLIQNKEKKSLTRIFLFTPDKKISFLPWTRIYFYIFFSFTLDKNIFLYWDRTICKLHPLVFSLMVSYIRLALLTSGHDGYGLHQDKLVVVEVEVF